MGEVRTLADALAEPAAAKPDARALDRARAARWIEESMAGSGSLSARIEAYRSAHPGSPSAATLRRWHAAWRGGGASALSDGRRGRTRRAYGWEARALELFRRPQRPSRATVAHWLREEGHASATASRVRRWLNSLPADVAGEDCAARAGRHHRAQNVGPYVARDLPRAPAPPALPKAPSRHAAAVAVEQALGLSDERPSPLVETPTGPVLLSQKWALHITEKRDHARERYANRIRPTLEDPDEIWMTQYDTPRGPEYRQSFVKRFDDRRNALSIVTELEDGSVLYNFMPRRDRNLNGVRVGTLLYPRRSRN